jgi:hypothetical protein
MGQAERLAAVLDDEARDAALTEAAEKVKALERDATWASEDNFVNGFGAAKRAVLAILEKR